MAYSQREKHTFKNTLVCLLKALENRSTTVELRNETSVKGQIIHVDAGMNVSMRNVLLSPVKGKHVQFTDFFVQGTMIRFVHIPDDIDIKKAISNEITEDDRHKVKVAAARDKTQEMRTARRRKFQQKEDKKTETSVLRQRTEVGTKSVRSPKTEYPDVL